jgi:hypothetical protein
MRWGISNKSAWALIVDDPDLFKSLPLYRHIGPEFVETTLQLSIFWQFENLVYIRQLVKKNADIYIYVGKKRYKDIKKTQKDFPEIKKIHIRKIKEKKITLLENIFTMLVKRYSCVTVWNIESLVLSKTHMDLVNSGEQPVLIKNPQGRVILVSSKPVSGNKDKDLLLMEIPSLYDLESIRNSLSFMANTGSPEYSMRAGRLADAYLLTQGNQRLQTVFQRE